MANIKSSAKRAEIDIRNRDRNRANISNIKGSIKKSLVSIKESSDNKADIVKGTMSVIDVVAKKGSIHKNKAARLKSRLMKKLNAAK